MSEAAPELHLAHRPSSSGRRGTPSAELVADDEVTLPLRALQRTVSCFRPWSEACCFPSRLRWGLSNSWRPNIGRSDLGIRQRLLGRHTSGWGSGGRFWQSHGHQLHTEHRHQNLQLYVHQWDQQCFRSLVLIQSGEQQEQHGRKLPLGCVAWSARSKLTKHICSTPRLSLSISRGRVTLTRICRLWSSLLAPLETAL